MKRQVTVVGGTPEFVRWSIRQTCPLREDTDVSSVDETEKRLRAIRAAGLALREHRVLDGIAIELNAQSLVDFTTDQGSESHVIRGFRISDVFDPWGGQQKVLSFCGNCPANVGYPSLDHNSLAGCFGWIRRDELEDSFIESLDECWHKTTSHETLTPRFIETQPRWYGIWSKGNLSGEELRFLCHWLAITLDQCPVTPRAVQLFCRVARSCLRHELTVDVELIPSGYSDGSTWTVQRHCDRCHASMAERDQFCSVCQKPGRGHPPIKRNVLGRRPYVDLTTVLGIENLQPFLLKYSTKRNANDR